MVFFGKNYSADILSMLMSNGAKLRKLEGLIGLKMKNYVKSTLAFSSRFSKNKTEHIQTTKPWPKAIKTISVMAEPQENARMVDFFTEVDFSIIMITKIKQFHEICPHMILYGNCSL